MDSFNLINVICLWLIVLFNLFLTLAVVRRINKIDTTNNEIEGLGPAEVELNKSAPYFEAVDSNGNKVTLDDYFDQNVLFIYVMPGCKPCAESMSFYHKLARELQKIGVRTELVSLGQDIETKEFMSSLNITLPIIIAPMKINSLKTDYKVIGTPFYCYVDNTAIIRAGGFLDPKSKSWAVFIDSLKKEVVQK